MKTGIIIPVRLDSRRLPGKALLEIAGRPLLGHVIEQTRRVDGAEVAVATSTRKLDDPIDAFARAQGVGVFRGPADDVAKRCLECADELGFDRFVRICGDSPFIDPELIEALLARHTETGADVVTNVMPRSYPPGQSVEVIARSALARLLEETSDPEDREHVTRYFYANPERFRVENVQASRQITGSDVRLAVDTKEDLERASFIAERLSAAAGDKRLEELIELAHAFEAQRG